MRRGTTAVLLALVLGAFAVASADHKKSYYDYKHEPKTKMCSLPMPWRYATYGCPTCKLDGGCITTVCNYPLDGKADVTIDLKCLFGHKVKFVAVSYLLDGYQVCVNNKKDGYFEDNIVLYDLPCDYLPKLRFIVQNKWWFNPEGKDLEDGDVCRDQCEKGRPCHTCIFEEVQIPSCKENCKKPECPYKDSRTECPVKLDDYCFKIKRKYDYIKVKLDAKRCLPEKLKSHVAVSYTDKWGNPACAEHTYYGYDDYFSFKAACHSSFRLFIDDDYFTNPQGPMAYPPIPTGDKCEGKFGPNVCDQCGPFKVDLGYCPPKPRQHEYDDKEKHD